MVELQNTQWLLYCQSKVSCIHVVVFLWIHINTVYMYSTSYQFLYTEWFMHSHVLAFCQGSTFDSASLQRWEQCMSATFTTVSFAPHALYICVFVFCTVYIARLYCDVVNNATEESMSRAVEDIKGLPSYEINGEVNFCFVTYPLIYFLIKWVITDARHDSTANAYHSTVPCLSGRFLQSCDMGVGCQCNVYQHSQDCGDLYSLTTRA